jgi:hypothetical protein
MAGATKFNVQHLDNAVHIACSTLAPRDLKIAAVG